jgi:uncharacterized membrane protein YeiH
MTLRRVTCCIGAAGVVAFGVAGASPASAAEGPSCVGQFVMAAAPQSAGTFGGFVRVVARTTDPNLGVGDVAPDATSDHGACS